MSGSRDLDLSLDMRAEELSVAELDNEPSDLAFTSRSEEGCSPGRPAAAVRHLHPINQPFLLQSII